MVRKYTYGAPFPTDAVVVSVPIEAEAIPFFTVKGNGAFSYKMTDTDIVYGLGEAVRGINKRGWKYISDNKDESCHSEDRHSLYGSHNFLIVDGKDRFGAFFDYPSHLEFDIGYSHFDEIVITPEEANLDVYIVEGDSLLDIVRQFRHMIGRSYIAPKWALGYGQSRWGYLNQTDIEKVVEGYHKLDLPLDSVYMDIDYMDHYKDFTLDDEAFPNFPEFVSKMKKKHIHLVPIIDAGVKIEKDYPIYEEGVENNYFCKDENGEDFVAAVWPGQVHFPDVLNEDSRKWFGRKYDYLLKQGIDGFWNDMNEPAIFYSKKRLDEALSSLESFKGQNLGVMDFFRLTGTIQGLSHSKEDYKSFYHNTKQGRIRHDKVHNLYGYNMTRAAGEAFEELEPDKRILIFSRSSYIGMHRYGGIWTGDNTSWWSHILLALQMMPALNMSGILYAGADLGGFNNNTTEDLLLRFFALGIFTPLMRNHSALGTREQEIYQFDHIDAFRNVLELRYRLLPYLYSEYMKASLRDDMYFKPMSFVYPEDTRCRSVEDQLILGNELMIAPVYTQNATGRYVYLPESMKMVRVKDGCSTFETTILDAGDHYIEVPLDEVVFFVRPEHVIPLSTGGKNVDEVDYQNVKLLGYVKTAATYEYYTDDGYSKDYENPEHFSTISVSSEDELDY